MAALASRLLVATFIGGGSWFAGKTLLKKLKEDPKEVVEKVGEMTGGMMSGGKGRSPWEMLAKGATKTKASLGPWSAHDLTLGLAGLAKVTEKEPPDPVGEPAESLSKDASFLFQAQHWLALTEAVYSKDAPTFSLISGIAESAIISAQWQPCTDTLRPAYALCDDGLMGSVVLAIRGTSDVLDMFLDAAGSTVSFNGGQVHEGFLHAAERLLDEVGDDLEEAMAANSGRKLVIVGHSLGAAAAILCAFMLRRRHPNVHVWAFGPPAFMSLDLAERCGEFATCFMAGHDVVPRFSIASLELLRETLKTFDWDRAMELARGDKDFQKICKGVDLMRIAMDTSAGMAGKVDQMKKLAGKALPGKKKGGSDKEDKKQHHREKEEGDGGGDGGGEKQEQERLYPPNPILVVTSKPPGCGQAPESRDEAPQQRQYGVFPSYEDADSYEWVLTKAKPQDLQEMIVSPWCISDHMPCVVGEGLSYFQKSVAPPLLGNTQDKKLPRQKAK